MATRTPRTRPLRALLFLVIVVTAIYGALLAGVRFSDATFAPKLALDLEGGTQIILTPISDDGADVTTEDIDQAIAIIRQRIDSSGVAEAEITSQGGRNIVVAIPGQPSEETLDLVRKSAQMRFRPVLQVADPGVVDLTAGTGAEGEAGTATPSPTPTAPPTQEELEAAARAAADADGDGTLSTEPATEPTAAP